MRAVPAQDIKRHGISFLDEMLEKGPVHVIKNNRPKYVVLSEERYQEFLSLKMSHISLASKLRFKMLKPKSI